MIGGIVTILGMFGTGALSSFVVRRLKATYPDAFKRNRLWFALLLVAILFLGFALSLLIGGLVNGADIDMGKILLALKWSGLVSAAGFVSFLIERGFVCFTKVRKRKKDNAEK